MECLRDVHKNYKKWLELAKRQRFFAKSNFNKDAVTKVYGKAFAEIDTMLESIPKPMQLKLPSLNTIQLPKLQKV
jgi:hypothetical protein